MADLTLTADSPQLSAVSISTTDTKMLRIVNDFLGYYGLNNGLTNQQKMQAFMTKMREIVESTSEKQEKRSGRLTSDAAVDADPPRL